MSRQTLYPPPIISDRLNLAMAMMDISGAELARRVGAERKSIYAWRNGVTAPNVNMLYRLEAALRKPKGWLQGLKKE